MKIAIVTLGCDKNTVDSERYVADLVGRGAQYTPHVEQAEIILVNTCGFIDAAKQESIEALIEAGRLKVDGACQAVVAIGCMVERHKSELLAELPEVDLFLANSEVHRLLPELEERGVLGAEMAQHPGVRVYTGDLPHVRYLKVSEGCDHGCAFCAIPLMRGRHRSFSLEELVREAQTLELQGAREVNLVAQDLAHYGRDRRDGVRLPELLAALARETSMPWFRLLYLYSAGLTPALLEMMAREPRILPYLDLPIQHGSDAVLHRMRRPERGRIIREKVALVRQSVPDVVIRTTCIVGFPGETEDDFRRLLELLEDVQFERVGAFAFSPQEGTRAADLADDVPPDVKLERVERLQDLQRAITAERYERFVGRTAQAIVDRAGLDGEPAQARMMWQADDVDGVTWLDGDAPAGSIVEVDVEAVVDDYDFTARLRRVLHRSAPRRVRSRALPMAGAVKNVLPVGGSFGR